MKCVKFYNKGNAFHEILGFPVFIDLIHAHIEHQRTS